MNANNKHRFSMLFITADKFPPFRVDILSLFVKEIAQRGHEIDWIMQSEQDCSAAYEKPWGSGTAFVGSTRNGEKRLDRVFKHILEFFHGLTLFRLLRTRHYDVLQVRDKYVTAIPAMLAAKIHKVKFVLWLSFPFPEAWIHYVKDGSARYPMFYYLRGVTQKFLLYKILAPAAKHVFLQSPEMKRMFVEQGISENKVTVVPMGYSSELICSDSHAASSTSESTKIQPFAIVYVGSLTRNRRIDFVLRTFSRVLDEVPQATLYLIGAGDDARDDEIISAECSSLNLDNKVVLTGFLPQERAFDYIKNAAVCISPIYPDPILNAGSPTKLVEYMAFGKAVIANDQIEQKQILEESGAGLCVPWDERAYADGIVSLLLDPGRAELMGQAGKRYIEKHRNYTYIASEVEKVYQRLICD